MGADIKKQIKRITKQIIEQFGFELSRIESSTSAKRNLSNAIRRVSHIETVVDIGASDGRWSMEFSKLLPQANFLLFEAAPSHKPKLNRLQVNNFNFHVFNVAASRGDGQVDFRLSPSDELGGGVGGPIEGMNSIRVQTKSIDSVVKEQGFIGPFLIKIDSQGHEFEILEGATETLVETTMIVIEVYTIEEPGRPSFIEICNFLKTKGFKPIGLMGVLNRPSDGFWWQADFIFLREGHQAFSNTKYA